MPTTRIARAEWRDFFNRFTRRHEGWLMSIEVLAPELGNQVEVQNAPLRSISVDEENGKHLVMIATGKDDRHLSHLVDAPVDIWLKQTEDGADEVLEIKTSEGHTLVYFRAPTRTERVDAI